MGYYIETDAAHGKFDAIADMYGESRDYTDDPKTARALVEARNGAVVIVVDNGMFEAAGLMVSVEEFDRFMRPDDLRPRKILWVSDRDAAFKDARAERYL